MKVSCEELRRNLEKVDLSELERILEECGFSKVDEKLRKEVELICNFNSPPEGVKEMGRLGEYLASRVRAYLWANQVFCDPPPELIYSTSRDPLVNLPDKFNRKVTSPLSKLGGYYLKTEDSLLCAIPKGEEKGELFSFRRYEVYKGGSLERVVEGILKEFVEPLIRRNGPAGI